MLPVETNWEILYNGQQTFNVEEPTQDGDTIGIVELSSKYGTEDGQIQATDYTFRLQNTTNFAVIEKEEATNKYILKVDYSNVKLEYEEGEKFDTTGLVVTAIYNDGTEEVTTDYTIDKTGELVAEDTYVTVSVGDCSVQIPIKVNGPTFRVTEASTHRVEAENVDTSNIVSDGGSSFIENSGSVSSNGQNLGHIAGGYVEIPFSTNKAYSLTVNTMFAFPETVMASEKIDKFEIDGVQYDFEDIEMGAADGNQYWNYKAITINTGEIQSGLHTFKLTFKGGGNYDYFEFIFAEVN